MTNDQAAQIINEAAARANREYSVARAKSDSESLENLRAYSQRQEKEQALSAYKTLTTAAYYLSESKHHEPNLDALMVLSIARREVSKTPMVTPDDEYGIRYNWRAYFAEGGE